MQSFVPKNRRPKFDLRLRVLDLNNVPLVSGNSFIKWDLPSSTAADHRGRSSKCTIKDHKVNYDYEKLIPIRLVVGKDQVLQECWIHFEILQEYQSGGKAERITLGLIKLNLAEYVDAGQHNEKDGGSITRRYLMQESKINSTLKIEIAMKQVEGDRNYSAPPLRTAPVFGGIAGIMAQEAAETNDDMNHMPSLSSKSRELGEIQDMYRRTLAASWAAQPGELRADECIEDIFGGGDGWGSHLHRNDDQSSKPTPTQSREHSKAYARDIQGANSDDEGTSRSTSSSNLASLFSKKRASPKTTSRPHLTPNTNSMSQTHLLVRRDTSDLKAGAVSGRGSLEQQARKMEAATKHGKRRPLHNEIDEMKNPYREDLRSWTIREKATS